MIDNEPSIEEIFNEILQCSTDEAFKYCDQEYEETKNPEYLVYKGHAHLVVGEYEEAIISVDSAFEEGCTYYEYGYNVKGEALLELGLYVESRRAFEKVISLTPNQYLATTFLIELDIREGFYQEAINRANDYLDNYAEDDKERGELLSIIGWTYMVDINEVDRGAEYLQKSIKVSQECSRAYTGLGIYYNYIKKYEEAIKYFNKAIEIDPTDGENYFGLAVCSKEIGDFSKVEENLLEANALLPEDNRVLLEYAFELLRQEREEEAIDAFKEILVCNPNDEEVMNLLESIDKLS